MIGEAGSDRGLATHLTLSPRVSRQAMSGALDVLENLRNLARGRCLGHLNVLENLRNLMNLACRPCLRHLMC